MPDSLVTKLYQRRIHVRPAAGAAAVVRQQTQARISHLTLTAPSLIVVRRGCKVATWNGRSVTAQAGQAVLLGEGCFDIVNHPDADGLYEAFWLSWPTQTLAPLRAATAAAPVVAMPVAPAFAEALEAAGRAIADPALPVAVAAHRMAEIVHWLRYLGVTLPRVAAPDTAQRARQYLSDDPAQAWTLNILAARLNMSAASLRRQLSRHGGFSDLLIDVRMSAALNLLQCTDLPVDRIALDVGYDSASRFAMRFRQRFGFAPSAVRGHHR
ncbi:MAG TPA: helix-turn-helix transcriptional regulator [Asticcacaulis sp.]|nr:helix-turn-helix transcriptional regulator [Asticcacaulis sp.]